MVFDNKYISKNIQNYRIQRGLSARELAESLGVTQGYINNLERGIGITPTVDNLDKMASILGVTIDDLLMENLCVYYGIEIQNETDQKILNNFYILSTSQKQFVLNFLREFSVYKKINDIKIERPETDLSNAVLPHYLQELLNEAIELSEDMQFVLLDHVKKLNQVLSKRQYHENHNGD